VRLAASLSGGFTSPIMTAVMGICWQPTHRGREGSAESFRKRDELL
jgi:hypothetical protein